MKDMEREVGKKEKEGENREGRELNK